MNIAVAVRLMPKAGDELEVDASGTDIDRELVDMAINEFDDQALEEAVLIKEATGATVTAVGLQADGIEQALRVAYARGADRVVSSTRARSTRTTRAPRRSRFAEAFRELAPDLVLIGVQTPYDVFGQTAPVPGRRARLAAGERRRRGHRGRRDRARRAGVRRRPARRARACSCRPSSACSPPARRRATCRWPGCARR